MFAIAIGSNIVSGIVAGVLTGAAGVITMWKKSREAKTERDALKTAIGKPNGRGNVVQMNEEQLRGQEADRQDQALWRTAISARFQSIDRRFDNTEQHINQIGDDIAGIRRSLEQK